MALTLCENNTFMTRRCTTIEILPQGICSHPVPVLGFSLTWQTCSLEITGPYYYWQHCRPAMLKPALQLCNVANLTTFVLRSVGHSHFIVRSQNKTPAKNCLNTTLKPPPSARLDLHQVANCLGSLTLSPQSSM